MLFRMGLTAADYTTALLFPKFWPYRDATQELSQLHRVDLLPATPRSVIRSVTPGLPSKDLIESGSGVPVPIYRVVDVLGGLLMRRDWKRQASRGRGWVLARRILIDNAESASQGES